jgi:parallel beta-helix repeat protein
MEKKTASAIMLTLLLTGMLTLAFKIQPVKAEPKIWYVDDSGGADFTKIQDAIYAASPGDTIYVYNGTYSGFLIEKNDLTVIGENRDTTIISGSGTLYLVEVRSTSNVTISGFTVQNTVSPWDAIRVTSCNNIIISGNKFTDNWCGIWIRYHSENIVITDNVITRNHCGISLFQSTYSFISGNNITNNEYGVYLYGLSENNIISHNNFINNTDQAYTDGSTNSWDDGYPSGGNYWSDYTGVDEYSGPYQNVTGSDGIGDAPYVIDESNRDNYPLIHPYGSIRNLDTNLTYLTIQSAINAPETMNGHTIFVEAGTYFENIVVDKTLTLMGENKESTIVDGNSYGHVINLKANSIHVSGFTLQNGVSGIFADHTNYHTIDNNIVQNNYDGIYLYGSLCNTLNDNLMTRNNFGFRIDESYSNTLRRNEMRDNIVYNFYFDLWGIIYDQHFIQDIDASNTVDGKPIYWWMYQSGKRVPTDAGFVVLYRSSNIFIEDLELTKNNHGIVFLHTSSSSIENVTIWKCETGIALHVSNYNNIRGNRIANNGNGIILEKSFYNNVEGNNVENNGLGIITWEANNNKIYHNNFNNTYQVYNTEPYYSINSWDDDYPSGGNYWSDYTDVDANGDGIGDTPYVIDADNQDRYPLINPWGTGTPVASFTWTPSIPKVGELVTFDASSSAPYGGTITTYEWDFGDGEYATGQIVTHAYANAGTYTVTLNVTDSEGLWDIEAREIQVVQPHGPEAKFTWTPLSPRTGEAIEFDASASLSGWNGTHEMPITEYRWDFGGGIKITTSTPILYYSFISPGIYYATLTVYAPGATPETDSTTHKVTVVSIPVGGYAVLIKVHARAEPIIPYVALITMLTAIFVEVKRKTKRKR